MSAVAPAAPPVLLLAGFGLLLLAALAVALIWAPAKREARLQARCDDIRDAYAPVAQAAAVRPPAWWLARVVGGVGTVLTATGVLSPKAIAELSATLAASGLRGSQALPVFVGAKAVLLIGLPALAFVLLRDAPLSPTLLHATLAGAAILGLLAPDLMLRQMRRRYLASVERAMPDALDLLVICAEAGLALEQGMERVAQEIGISSRPCAIELTLTHNELRILADRRVALINMGRRTGLVGLQRLAGTLAQALQYGTPLGRALRTLAADLRGEALTRFEARAARLPVLMTLPMILFILPCVFLVVAGPAVLAVVATVLRQ